MTHHTKTPHTGTPNAGAARAYTARAYAAPRLDLLGHLATVTAGPDPVSGGVDALIGQSGGFEVQDPS